jgi:hypothetical protein
VLVKLQLLRLLSQLVEQRLASLQSLLGFQERIVLSAEFCGFFLQLGYSFLHFLEVIFAEFQLHSLQGRRKRVALQLDLLRVHYVFVKAVRAQKEAQPGDK